MVRVNLLPTAYQLRWRRTRRLRKWVVAGALVVGLQVPAVLVVRQMGAQTRELQRGLAQAAQQRQVIVSRGAAIAKELAEVHRQTQLADRLSRKHPWSELCAALSECVPDTMILTQLETDPPKSDAKPTAVVQVRIPAGKLAAPPEPSSVAGGMVIRGMAIDHDSVAAFLRKLNENDLFGRWSLESALRQPFLKGEGIAFTVRTQW